MTGGEIAFVICALAGMAGLAVWITRPLFRDPTAEIAGEEPPADLLAVRHAAILELRDLDEDHASGRLDDADHARLRADVIGDGAAALEALDRWAADSEARRQMRLARVEADVAAVRETGVRDEP